MKQKKKSSKSSKNGRKESSRLPKFCQACGDKYNEEDNHKKRTNHHIWVQRHFHGDGPTETLCQDCHTELDNSIPQRPKLKPAEYQERFDDFVKRKKEQRG